FLSASRLTWSASYIFWPLIFLSYIAPTLCATSCIRRRPSSCTRSVRSPLDEKYPMSESGSPRLPLLQSLIVAFAFEGNVQTRAPCIPQEDPVFRDLNLITSLWQRLAVLW